MQEGNPYHHGHVCTRMSVSDLLVNGPGHWKWLHFGSGVEQYETWRSEGQRMGRDKEDRKYFTMALNGVVYGWDCYAIRVEGCLFNVGRQWSHLSVCVYVRPRVYLAFPSMSNKYDEKGRQAGNNVEQSYMYGKNENSQYQSLTSYIWQNQRIYIYMRHTHAFHSKRRIPVKDDK